MPPILALLPLAPLVLPAAGGDAECESVNTNCRCAENDPHCSFPTCVDVCTCVGGECEMDICLANCHCLEGGCAMSSCMSNCDNGGEDVTPPLCIVTEDLDPDSRGRETPGEVCRRLHWDAEATTPYVCDKRYACCTGDAKQIESAGTLLGKCTKDLKIEAIQAEGVAEKYEATARGFAIKRSQSSGGYVGIAVGVVGMLSIYLLLQRFFGRARGRQHTRSE